MHRQIYRYYKNPLSLFASDRNVIRLTFNYDYIKRKIIVSDTNSINGNICVVLRSYHLSKIMKTELLITCNINLKYFSLMFS